MGSYCRQIASTVCAAFVPDISMISPLNKTSYCPSRISISLSLSLSLSLSAYNSCRRSLILSQNSTHEAIKSRLHSCNSCCRLFQNLLSSRLMSKNNKLCGCAPKQCFVICYMEMGDKPDTCNFPELYYLPLYSLFHHTIAFVVFMVLPLLK